MVEVIKKTCKNTKEYFKKTVLPIALSCFIGAVVGYLFNELLKIILSGV